MKNTKNFKEKNLSLILVMGIIAVSIIVLSMNGCVGPTPPGNETVNETVNETKQPTEPSGKIAKPGDNVEVNYIGRFENGTVFDMSAKPLQFAVGGGQMIIGFDEAVVGMKEGETRNVTIPPEKAYGVPQTVPRTQKVPLEQFMQAVGKEPTLGMEFSAQGVFWPMKILNIENVTKEVTSDEMLKNIQGVQVLPNIDKCHTPGKVTILEFSEFQCPFCSRAVPTVEQIKDTYGDKVEIEFKHYIVHASAQYAAEASECARDQGKFWEMHDALFDAQFANGGDVGNTENLKSIAKDLGLDTEKFNSCLDNREKEGKVKADMSEGGKYGITGTPGFVLDCNVKITGALPYDTFKQTIDALFESSNQTITYQEVTVIIQHNPTPNTQYSEQLKVFEVGETEMKIGSPMTGETLNFEITLVKIMDECDAMGIEKRDKPDVNLFVMSYCPYGTQIEKGIIPVQELLGSKADINIKFVHYLMHGKQEGDENTVQYCIDKEQKDKFWPYLSCFLEAGDSAGCLDKVGIDKDKLQGCTNEADQMYSISANIDDQSTWLNGRFPIYKVHEELAKQYGVGGSPAVVINDKQIQTNRDPESLKKAICCAFNEKPAECEQALSSAAPSPGFGFTGGGGGSAGSCG